LRSADANLIYQQNPISGCSVCWKRLGWLAGLGVAGSPPSVALVLGDPVCGGGLLELACWLVQPQPQPAISSQPNEEFIFYSFLFPFLIKNGSCPF